MGQWNWLKGTLLGGFFLTITGSVFMEQQADLESRGEIVLSVLAVMFGTAWLSLSLIEFGAKYRHKDEEGSRRPLREPQRPEDDSGVVSDPSEEPDASEGA